MTRLLALALLMAGTTATAQEGPAPDCGIYTYKAVVVRVIDVDTIVADIDLGFEIWIKNEHLRLSGIDGPERNEAEADAATMALRNLIDGEELFICTERMKRKDREATGSFGRYLATVHHDGRNVNEWLLEQGLAVPYGN